MSGCRDRGVTYPSCTVSGENLSHFGDRYLPLLRAKAQSGRPYYRGCLSLSLSLSDGMERVGSGRRAFNIARVVNYDPAAFTLVFEVRSFRLIYRRRWSTRYTIFQKVFHRRHFDSSLSPYIPLPRVARIFIYAHNCGSNVSLLIRNWSRSGN